MHILNNHLHKQCTNQYILNVNNFCHMKCIKTMHFICRELVNLFMNIVKKNLHLKCSEVMYFK